MKKHAVVSILSVVPLCLTLCLSSCSKSDDSASAGNGTVIVQMQADFAASAAAKHFFFPAAPKLVTCPTTTPALDGTEYAAGLDCDDDGGVISYITPQTFKIALKRLTFIRDDSTGIDIIPDTGTLANAQVYDLSTVFTFAQQEFPTGSYTDVEAEVYYYEITMPINNPPTVRTLRVYLSDDDFPAEGSLGHHQGDIILIGSDGSELGWVYPGIEWIDANLQTDPATVVRPGSTDPETGHQRGLYGNAEMWNHQIFMQGADKDIYLIMGPFELEIAENVSSTVSFSFPVQDTWFYEDFDNDGAFNPCENTYDACAANAEWTPIFNPPVITIQ